MKTFQFSIKGRIPSKKNSKQIIYRGRYPMLISSKNYREWEDTQKKELKKLKNNLITNIKKIEIVIEFPDKRKSDLTNKAESVMDLMVDMGIIEDDSWQIVPELVLKSQGSCKNPVSTISIYYI